MWRVMRSLTEPVASDQHPVDTEQWQAHHHKTPLLAEPLGGEGSEDVAEAGGETEGGPHQGRGVLLSQAGREGGAGPANAGPALEDQQ